MKYLLSEWSKLTPFTPFLFVTSLTEVYMNEWSTMTPFTPLLIVTSLTEVCIQRMEYDDPFHTSAHCDLTV